MKLVTSESEADGLEANLSFVPTPNVSDSIQTIPFNCWGRNDHLVRTKKSSAVKLVTSASEADASVAGLSQLPLHWPLSAASSLASPS